MNYDSYYDNSMQQHATVHSALSSHANRERTHYTQLWHRGSQQPAVAIVWEMRSANFHKKVTHVWEQQVWKSQELYQLAVAYHHQATPQNNHHSHLYRVTARDDTIAVSALMQIHVYDVSVGKTSTSASI